jgi:hypothetical protein
MKKFEGNINGKIYTDKEEFDKAILSLDETDDINVSYSYISVFDNKECMIKDDSNYVSENQYVKIINNEDDVIVDDELIDKLKNAPNKSEIKQKVYDKIVEADFHIEDNLLRIKSLESDYRKLGDKIKNLNNEIEFVLGEIKKLEDANNNYYLYKDYYTNIKNLLDTITFENIMETNDECDCKCNVNECKCDNKVKENTLNEDIYAITPNDFEKFFKRCEIYSLPDLVDFFLKKY